MGQLNSQTKNSSASSHEHVLMTCDVVISGGGPVGLLLAIGLARLGQKVVLAEAYLPSEDAPNSFDGRVLALSYGSMKVLEQLEIWPELQPFVTEIHHVHVSQKGYLGITQLHAEEVNVPALGYSIQSSDLGKVLWQQVRTMPEIQVLCPARLVDFTEDKQGIKACIEMHSEANKITKTTLVQVHAQLMVGADGTESQVRKLLALPIEVKSYHAYGVIAQIKTEMHPQNWSYERFTEEGPVALLPMKGHFHKAVLVCPEEEVESVTQLDDTEFIQLFASKMGERLGAFTQVSSRVAYPLKETYVPQMSKGRAVLMGNASHTQHPVAAQGLNLGIQDIDVFLEQVSQSLKSSQYKNQYKGGNSLKTEIKEEAFFDIGLPAFLERYAQNRKKDHERVMGLTDGLIQIFQHRSPLVGHLRGIGLMAMQAMPSVKRRFARFAMGGKK